MTGQQGLPLPHENAAPDGPRSGAHLENPSGPTKNRGAFVGPEERSINVIPFPASRASISRSAVHPLLRTAYMSRPVDPRPALRRAAVERFWLDQMVKTGSELSAIWARIQGGLP
jgi:hypothetical protein